MTSAGGGGQGSVRGFNYGQLVGAHLLRGQWRRGQGVRLTTVMSK